MWTQEQQQQQKMQAEATETGMLKTVSFCFTIIWLFLHADERNRRYCMYRDGDIYAKQQRKTIITTIQTWKTLLDSVCFVRLSVFSSFYLVLSSQLHTKHKYMDIDDNDHDDADSVKTSKTRMNIREKYALHFSGFKAEWKAAVSNNKKRKCCV